MIDYKYIRDISIDWDKIDPNSYLHDIRSIKKSEHLKLDKNITFFVGENGSGKSTFLEGVAVAYGLNPEGGTKNYNFKTYDSHSELADAIKLTKGARRPQHSYFLRAESFYNVATQTEEYRGTEPEDIYYERYGGKSFHHQSHGESFLALLQAEFVPEGLYILDEPEAALSPQRQLTLLMEIERNAKKGAQYIIASHSPILLAAPNATILSFENDGIIPIDYEETESYQVMDMFINNKEYLLSRLLKEKD